MMKVGIFYIALGRYHVFWPDFFHSAEQHLLPGCENHYYVFTDNADEIRKHANSRVTILSLDKLGWPYDTLYRFDMFLSIESLLASIDFVYFFNANMHFNNTVGEEILPYQQGLAAVLHPWLNPRGREHFTYETNPQSTAYIAPDQGDCYFMGSFNGGKTETFLQMSRYLSNNIQKDLERGIIALWHDESHLNRYLLDHPVLAIPPTYAFPEEWRIGNEESFELARFDPSERIIMTNKEHPRWGGREWLRGF